MPCGAGRLSSLWYCCCPKGGRTRNTYSAVTAVGFFVLVAIIVVQQLALINGVKNSLETVLRDQVSQRFARAAARGGAAARLWPPETVQHGCPR